MEETLTNSGRIDYFKQLFGEGHYYFACQASVPLLLSADLLYKLWLNFKTYKDASGAVRTIPYLAVSDLLLSNLCRTVGQQLYKMEEEVRLRLLKELDKPHKCQIAEFLRQYAERSFTPSERSIQKIHLTTAKSFLNPATMAREIREELLDRGTRESEKLHLLNLYYQLTPQVGAGTELGLILQEAQGDADDVLEIDLPKHLRRKVSPPEEPKVPEPLFPASLYDDPLEVKKLDLSNRSLGRFPEGILQFANLEELYLQENQVEEIPPEIATLTHLKVFRANHNRIRKIPDELLRLPALRKLWLYNNYISELPAAGIALPEITLIDLSNNLLDAIPAYTLEGLQEMSKLKHLYLRENHIHEVPPGIGYLTRLETLNLKGNRIATLPVSMRALKNLKTNRTPNEWRRGLDLRDNLFSGIEPEVFDGEPAQIIETILSRQQYDGKAEQLIYGEIPADAHKIIKEAKEKKLTRIDLGKLGLKNLPEALFKLRHLKVLILGSWRSTNEGPSNQLNRLSRSIGELTELEEIYLSDNHIQQLPDELLKLSKLRVLSLSRNGISHIPDIILKMHSLQELYLSGNPLRMVPPTLVNLPNLRELGLNGVTIEGYPSEITFAENCLDVLKAFFAKKIKIALVDDHKLFRRGVTELLEGFGNYSIMWEAGNGREAIEMIAKGNVPEIMVLDDTMPEMDGYETLRWLKKHHPQVRVLILSMRDYDEAIARMLQLRPDGYILKNAGSHEIRDALEALAQGRNYFSKEVSEVLELAASERRKAGIKPIDSEINKRSGADAGAKPPAGEKKNKRKPVKDVSADALIPDLVTPENKNASPFVERLVKLYKTHYAHYLTVVLRIVKDQENARNIIQDVFLKLLSREETFKSVKFFEAYVLTTLKYASIDFLKKQEGQPTSRITPDDVSELPEEDNDPLFADPDLLRKIIGVTDLSPEEKMLVEYVSKGADMEEIAARMLKDSREVSRMFFRLKSKLYNAAIYKLNIKDFKDTSSA